MVIAAATVRPPRPGPRRLAVVLVAAVVVIAAIVTLQSSSARASGPIASDSKTSAEFPLADDQIASWGSQLPTNTTKDELTIESIEPVGISGLELVGLSITYPDVDGAIVNSLG